MKSLCEGCVHVREVVSGTGSRFQLCRLSQTDGRYAKYPAQPVLRCAGFEPRLSPRQTLVVLPGELAYCRLDAQAAAPDWAVGEVVSITRTSAELSIVCSAACVPAEIESETGWRCLRVAGKLDFSMIGVLAALTGALAAANISVCALSTFDTDYLLVKTVDLQRAVAALTEAGHAVQ
jgi:hypothetical protein